MKSSKPRNVAKYDRIPKPGFVISFHIRAASAGAVISGISSINNSVSNSVTTSYAHTNPTVSNNATNNTTQAPNSPQLRTMAPCPRRFTAPSARHLGFGFETPSPRRSSESMLPLSAGSYGSQGLFGQGYAGQGYAGFDRDGTTSFSPSFIAELDAERDVYLQGGDYMRDELSVYRQSAVNNGGNGNSGSGGSGGVYNAHYAQSTTNTNTNHTTHPHNTTNPATTTSTGRGAVQVSTPERQAVARANALIREDHAKDKFRESY